MIAPRNREGCGHEHAGAEPQAGPSATGVLRAEHDVILGVVAAAERAVAEAGRVGDSAFWQDVVTFFQSFADRCHHAKEEGLLFPRLEALGLPRSGGPIGVMLAEHDQGRALLRTIAALALQLASGEATVHGRFRQALREYCALIVQHIAKENNVLFPMADRLLSGDDQREVAEGFRAHEVEEMGAGEHERLHAIADRVRAAA